MAHNASHNKHFFRRQLVHNTLETSRIASRTLFQEVSKFSLFFYLYLTNKYRSQKRVKANLYVYLRNGIVFKIFVIVVFQDLVVIEGQPLWP